MNGPRLFFLIVVLTLLTTLVGAADGAQIPTAYVPGTTNVLTNQPTADLWNHSNSQIGDESSITTTRHSFFPVVGHLPSDNNHDHLGQTWTGMNNSLKIQGTFGTPNFAPLVLSNSQADGFGLVVNSPGGVGVYIGSALFAGMYVQSTQSTGVWVDSAGDDGVHVSSAGDIGVYANARQANGQWGFYTPDRIFGSIGMFSAISLVAQVNGPDRLTSGDLVAVVGLADPLPGSTARLPRVHLADSTSISVIGVIENRLILAPRSSQLPPERGEALTGPNAHEVRSADGPALAGDYVAITVLGAAQVKVDSTATIEAGQRLTVSSQPGHVRALRTVQVDGVTLDEGGPTLGVALEAAKDGLVWVMVNP